jgi:hypothetical protein
MLAQRAFRSQTKTCSPIVSEVTFVPCVDRVLFCSGFCHPFKRQHNNSLPWVSTQGPLCPIHLSTSRKCNGCSCCDIWIHESLTCRGSCKSYVHCSRSHSVLRCIFCVRSLVTAVGCWKSIHHLTSPYNGLHSVLCTVSIGTNPGGGTLPFVTVFLSSPKHSDIDPAYSLWRIYSTYFIFIRLTAL